MAATATTNHATMVPMVIVIMGVSGAGKSTVGAELAGSLGWKFFDADDLHPPANVEKMRSATPLSDEDRLPWLEALRHLVADLSTRDENAVLACSALRAGFRERLQDAGSDVRFAFLSAGADLLDQRLRQRETHYMPTELLRSQLETLEPPEDALRLDASLPPEELVRQIRAAWGLQ